MIVTVFPTFIFYYTRIATTPWQPPLASTHRPLQRARSLGTLSTPRQPPLASTHRPLQRARSLGTLSTPRQPPLASTCRPPEGGLLLPTPSTHLPRISWDSPRLPRRAASNQTASRTTASASIGLSMTQYVAVHISTYSFCVVKPIKGIIAHKNCLMAHRGEGGKV